MPIRSRNLTSDTRIKAARRPLKIIELRVAGMSMPLIAAKMKCSLPVVHRIITRELAKLTEKLAETTAQARQLALQRCEEHYHQARPKAST